MFQIQKVLHDGKKKKKRKHKVRFFGVLLLKYQTVYLYDQAMFD